MIDSVAAVIPVGAGRAENLIQVLTCLNEQTRKPDVVILACDGPEAHLGVEPKEGWHLNIVALHLPKHQPGMEQPRNIGVREAEKFGISHVWFIDTDVIFGKDCLSTIIDTAEFSGDSQIIVGPYDWMPPGERSPMPDLYNDPRWPSFDRYSPAEVVRNDLAAGLACFSGNLVWPVEDFKRVGGFWNELHHGRCEDGELGLRAVSMGIGITFCRTARGWHMDHPRDMAWVQATNARDVPMLNERHPWVQGEGLFVVEEDGKRFNSRCPCGWEGNTAEIFAHQAQCDQRGAA